MALKSAQPDGDKVDIEEVLDHIDKTLDRTKVLYEQYFLGMQKQPPAQLHTDVERRLRELQQLNIRNTGLRYRFATLQQKFGSYNSYWRRTVRQIENGTYIRNLAKISRNAALTGEDVPEEILAAMPKRMRDQVKRDREQALAMKRRRAEDAVDLDVGDLDDDSAVINNLPPKITRPPPMQKSTHVLGGDDDGDFDIEAFFASVTDEKPTPKASPIHAEPPDEDTQPNAQIPTRPARVPAKAVPRTVEDDPTGVHAQRASRAAEDEPTGIVTPAPRMLPGLPTKQSSIPGVTNLAAAANPRASTAPPPAPTQTQGIRPPVPPTQPSARPSARGPTQSTARPPSVPGATQATARPPSAPGATQSTARPPGAPGQTQSIARPQTQPSARLPTPGQTQAIRPPVPQTQPIARPIPAPEQTQAIPRPEQPARAPDPKSPVLPVVPPRPAIPRPATPVAPSIPAPPRTQALPVVPTPAKPGDAAPARSMGAGNAPSQQSRPIPIVPGAASGRQPVPVQSMQGPFERTPVAPKPKAPEQPAQRPPPGMNEADVNALYAKYVKAKEMVGEDAGPGAYGKLMKTINAQAPKIMEQYKAKGVEFSVVVKDNQVIIKAKPKT